MKKGLIPLIIAFSNVIAFGQMNPLTNISSIQTSPTVIKDKCFGEILDTCYLTTSKDCDEDGYASSKWLVVKMQNAAPIANAYLEVWLKTTSGDYKMHTSNSFTLPQLHYEYNILGTYHLEGTLIVKVFDVSTGWVSDESLLDETVGFESPKDDYLVKIAYFNWDANSDIDADGDGYFSRKNLKINLDGCPTGRIIYFIVSVFTQPEATNPIEYYVSPNYNLNKPGEINNVYFGLPNMELEQGEYRIVIQAFDASSHFPLMDSYTLESHAKFELSSDDLPVSATFSISDIYIGDEGVDMDHDGYYRSIDMNFTASVDSGSYNLTARILERRDSSSNWYYTPEITPEFAVSQAGTEQKVIVDGLPGPLHDFKIELYNGTSLVAEADPDDFECLRQHKCESSFQDRPIQIKAVTLDRDYDWDGDGLPSAKTLLVEFANVNVADSAYLLVGEYRGEGYFLLDSTEIFEIPAGKSIYHVDVIPKRAANLEFYLCSSAGTGMDSYQYWDPSIMEPQDEDLIYSLKSMEWTDSIDNDGDGYCTYRRLAIDIDVHPIPAECSLYVSLIAHPVLAGPMDYIITEKFIADSTSDDLYYLDIGGTNPEVSLGTYCLQFFLRTTLPGVSTIGWAGPAPIKMERTENDNKAYFIENIGFTDNIDMDQDGYNRSSNLSFLLSTTSETPKTVTAKTSWIEYGEMVPSDSYTTPAMTVSTSDPISVEIPLGSTGTELEHNGYYFDLTILEGSVRVASIPSFEMPELCNVLFESVQEDNPFKIDSVYFGHSEDWDGDGLYSSRELIIDFDAYANLEPVYLEIYYYFEGIYLHTTTEVFEIIANNPQYSMTITCVGSDAFRSELLVKLYHASNSKFVCEAGTDERADMEYPEDDLFYYLDSYSWTDSIDNDGDGYCSYRQLAFDFDVMPISRSINMFVSMCKLPVMAGPCDYITTEYFSADSTSSDKFHLDLGGVNPELKHSECLLQLIVKDSITDSNVISWTTIYPNPKMEFSAEDVLTCLLSEAQFTGTEIDEDEDGYYNQRDLHFSVEINSGSHILYAKVLKKHSNEDEYRYYCSTDPFVVNEDKMKEVGICIGSSDAPLNYNLYDLRLEVYKQAGDILLASIDSETDPILDDVPFETEAEDSPVLLSKKELAGIRIYPNPSLGKLSVDLGESIHTSAAIISIYNINGELVEVLSGTATGKHLYEFNLEKLISGIYMLKIQTLNTTEIIKLIRQ